MLLMRGSGNKATVAPILNRCLVLKKVDYKIDKYGSVTDSAQRSQPPEMFQ